MPKAQEKPTPTLNVVLGDSGTSVYQGIINDAYNTKLVGMQGIELYDQMRKSDGTVKAAVLATELPIIRAQWIVQPARSIGRTNGMFAPLCRPHAFAGSHPPKNAYNLLRLLHSCLSWLTTGEPMAAVPADLRPTPLDIKHGRTPIKRTLELAQALAAEVSSAGCTGVDGRAGHT